MRRIVFVRLVCAVAASLVLVGAALAAKAPTKKELDAMSLFLSNFTELGFMDASAEAIADPDNYADAVRFGVGHNYLNNRKSRIVANKKGADVNGDMSIEAKFVEESVEKYFGVKVRADKSADDGEPAYHFDGKRFHFNGKDQDPGKVYYARVDEVDADGKGTYEATGVVYNVKDKKEVLADFRAVFKDWTWKGRKTYALVTLETEYR